ncbi:UNVERIFIED_ORG: hypothetical protein J3D59_004226 [Pseudomonas fluorescens]
MENYYPSSFLELLGGCLIVFAVFAGGISLIPPLRIHLLRLLAIAFVCSLALFSNNVWTYFVAIFVIATAVTELEFLQNLAAIVRGNKEYFDYRKEVLSTDRKLSSLASEVAQSAVVAASGVEVTSGVESASADTKPVHAEPVHETPEINAEEEDISDQDSSTNPPDEVPLEAKNSKQNTVDLVDLENVKIAPSVLTSKFMKVSPQLKRIYELENKAFDALEEVYGTAIERGVRLKRADMEIELDGLAVRAGNGEVVIFEIKYLGSNRNFINWVNLVGLQLERIKGLYKKITNRTSECHLVLILEENVALTDRQKKALLSINPDHQISVFNAEYLETRN